MNHPHKLTHHGRGWTKSTNSAARELRDASGLEPEPGNAANVPTSPSSQGHVTTRVSPATSITSIGSARDSRYNSRPPAECVHAPIEPTAAAHAALERHRSPLAPAHRPERPALPNCLVAPVIKARFLESPLRLVDMLRNPSMKARTRPRHPSTSVPPPRGTISPSPARLLFGTARNDCAVWTMCNASRSPTNSLFRRSRHPPVPTKPTSTQPLQPQHLTSRTRPIASVSRLAVHSMTRDHPSQAPSLAHHRSTSAGATNS